jgi:hypothetical protein
VTPVPELSGSTLRSLHRPSQDTLVALTASSVKVFRVHLDADTDSNFNLEFIQILFNDTYEQFAYI